MREKDGISPQDMLQVLVKEAESRGPLPWDKPRALFCGRVHPPLSEDTFSAMILVGISIFRVLLTAFFAALAALTGVVWLA